jgi:hypothetical protein
LIGFSQEAASIMSKNTSKLMWAGLLEALKQYDSGRQKNIVMLLSKLDIAKDPSEYLK